MKMIILLLTIAIALKSNAQQKILTEEELVSVIFKFHPVAKQAAIDIKIAKADVLSSKGVFDPHLTSETARKDFGGITYYDRQANGLKIPTWYGIDLFAGTERINGSRVNPQETTESITYMGFSIQPLQNLLMDKRRATLMQAKNFYKLSEVQRRAEVNDLLQEALYTYWDWWEKYHLYQMLTAAVANSEKRLALVKTAYQLGDRPAIDTLEALTQVQSFRIKLSEAYQNLIKAILELSAFLWTENGDQQELHFGVMPQVYNPVKTFTLSDVLIAVTSHPLIKQYDYKLKGLQIDKRLAFQSLIPELKIKYNQTGYNLSKTVNGPWFNNNYRFGVSLSMPLRLSEGRGDYQKAKLKLEKTRLDQANKQVQLYTKAKQYYTDWQQTELQLGLQTQLLANIKALQKGEEVKFANGESYLFLINARELKTIETEQKTIELKAKTQKAAIGVRWSAGLLAL